MPITRPAAEALADLLHQLRPAWDTAGVLHQLRKLAHDPRDAGLIAQAAIRAAMDTDARTPAVIPTDGSHWNLEKPQAVTTPRLTPEHECPEHTGQWRGSCGPCNGVAKGERNPITGTDPLPDLTPPKDYDPAAATIGDYFRHEARVAAARAAERFAELHPEKRPEVVHVVTDVPATTPAE